MKRNFTTLLAIVALLISIFSAGQQAFAQSARDEIEATSRVPLTVSYQGNVTVDGTPFTGSGKFKFAIVNSTGATSYWSNDGTSVGGSQPTASVPVPVSDGLFNVLLGDRMTALSADVFSSSSRSLRIWFSSDGGATFTQLTPDRDIASVPFALVAEKAGDADTLDGLHSQNFASSTHDHDSAYVNDNANEVDNNDISAGSINPDRINGTAWTSLNDGLGSLLDADKLDGQDASYFQRRVSGTCTPGSTIQTINSDGTVTCMAALSLPGTTSIPLNGSAHVVNITSVAVGADGLPVIAYVDDISGNLKLIHCYNITCEQNTNTTLDTSGYAERPSVAIGPDGAVLVSYYDVHNNDLKAVHCFESDCSDAAISTLALSAEDNLWSNTSATFGTDGFGVISYYDQAVDKFKVAHCSNVACSSATITIIDGTATDVGDLSSITIGADGLPVISYVDHGNNDLKVAHCENAACTTSSTAVLDDSTMIFFTTSITLGTDGLALISYYDMAGRNLKVAHCNNTACSSATTYILDSIGYVGSYSSIIIGSDGLGIISYYDETNGDLKVAHCSNVLCSSAVINTIHTTNDVGSYTSIAIGVDGLPVISYVDLDSTVLRFTHCANKFCIPNKRGR